MRNISAMIDEADRGRILILRRRPLVDRIVDVRRDDPDARRRAEEQRRFEILDAADEAQDGRTGQRRQHQLQRDVRNVRKRDAPHMRAASSRLGSIARKASTISRNRNGTEYCIMCQTTPP